ncbi:MAG: TfoX/Sxy family protein [Hyphomicrobiaceae bacterium]
MAVDEDMNQKFREALGQIDGLSEKKMMGGMCFMLNGNMIGGADRTKDGRGRFMFRIGKDNDETGRAMPGAQPMVQGGRRMSGLFFVEEDDCSPDVMAQWIALAIDNAQNLPKK